MVADLRMIKGTAEALGLKFEPAVDLEKMLPGDMYLAHRNGPVKLLTCLHDDRENGWVLNKEGDYPYDTSECFRVVNS
jgi:hypothetical protein